MTKKTAILTGFVLLKFVLQYVLISPEYDLQRDEYLHLDQANHLAWGYLSVPPVTSWISWIIKGLGNSVFWVKFFPALFGALTIVVVWKAIETLNGTLAALILGATGVLFSVLLRLNTLYQPNSLDVLCWTALYYVLIKYLNSRKTQWLYAGAVVFAIGFLNKYNIAFLLIGFVPALLLTPQRKLLINPHVVGAGLVALLLILPNLLWQYTNQFPVLFHMKELAEKQLVNVDRNAFLKAQLLFFVGSLPVIIAGIYALLVYKPFETYKSFAWAIGLTLGVFLYLKAKDYYAIGLYPIYLSFGSVFVANQLQTGWKRYLLPAIIALPVLFFIPMYQVAFPNKSPDYMVSHRATYQKLGQLRWEDGKDHALPQDYADMLGWRELAAKVDKVYTTLPGNTLVLCDNYGQAGAINFYTKRSVQAVSFNADYLNWFNLDQPYANLIRVKEAENQRDELNETSPYFRTSLAADSITNPFAREQGTTIFLFTGANVDIRQRIKHEIDEVNSQRR
ncbi:glycosyltransferase family 39 protein [Spirosoma sp. BT704]|uniref:Glycosyltransferase family 39 protein n=2 Tax=Spirosoma validum TaxID=2771355 RepID=A0A927B269_9BACT|nr:glycosyltransferase family 39 protein [Spirosoma validum]